VGTHIVQNENEKGVMPGRQWVNVLGGEGKLNGEAFLLAPYKYIDGCRKTVACQSSTKRQFGKKRKPREKITEESNSQQATGKQPPWKSSTRKGNRKGGKVWETVGKDWGQSKDYGRNVLIDLAKEGHNQET